LLASTSISFVPFEIQNMLLQLKIGFKDNLVDLISKEKNMHQCFDFHQALGPKVEVVGKEH